jgi:hypothetical protein
LSDVAVDLAFRVGDYQTIPRCCIIPILSFYIKSGLCKNAGSE